LELNITWLNRIIFLKLLESQLIKYNKDQNFSFLHTNKIQSFDELRELFFEVLAIPANERKEKFKTKFQNIPYLNSSLFELNQIEKDTIRINQLTQNSQIPIFNATVLKKQDGKKITGTKNLLEYIFEFLDSYNFGSDSKSEIIENNKTIINSAVLGLIFEKINGYEDGSFFTPGSVTMYMCLETIRKAVVEKFKSSEYKEFKNIKDFTDLNNKIDKITIQQANEIFNKIRICDPAVGSGHFLVSALNELISIKSKLDLIVDKNNVILKKTYCDVENDELIITHRNEQFEYDKNDRECQKIQETIFHEKQNLIENCLFGVDINSKSVNICRLRLWIELLKNAYYTEKLNYKELETLPNIDINIKCGNSLISQYTLNGNGTKNNDLITTTKKYKQQVNDYKVTNDRGFKKSIVKTLEEIHEKFSTYSKPTDDDP